MLQLDQVKKSFNSRTVLDIPSFRFNSGIYWLKGPNGSGKTTLLRMVAGLLPFRGNMVFNGISLRRQALGYRQLASWAEAEPLYPAFLTGTGLLALYRSIRKANQADVDRLVVVMGVDDYLDSPIGAWSSGMIKKFSLLLAFVGNPSLIVLDEPLITLDENALSTVAELIRQRCLTNPEILFLLSSHQEADMGLLPAGEEILVKNQTLIHAASL
jgi:ABC-2 type transport system ATP-binding protein